MLDIIKMFPGSVPVRLDQVEPGDRLVLVAEDGEDATIRKFTARVVDEGYIEATNGVPHYVGEDRGCLFRLPPKLPVEVGSVIRDVRTQGAEWGVHSWLLGVLTTSGWRVVSDSGLTTVVQKFQILSFKGEKDA